MADPRYEADFSRSFERAQAQYENQTPEYKEDEDDAEAFEDEEDENN